MSGQAGAVVWAEAGRWSTDRRLAATFLELTNLRGGSGFPRQAVFGARLLF
jgi:hypothetical protein